MHHRLTIIYDLWLWQIETTSRKQESKVTITIIKLRHVTWTHKDNEMHVTRQDEFGVKTEIHPRIMSQNLYTLLLTYGWINKKMKCFKMSLYIMFLVTNYQRTIIFGYIIILWMIEIWKISKMLHDIIAWTYNVFGCVVEQRIGEMIMANNTNIAYTCTWHLRCVCY